MLDDWNVMKLGVDKLLKISQYLLINPITYLQHRKVPTTRAIRPVGLMVSLMVPSVLQRMMVGTSQTIQSCHTVVKLRWVTNNVFHFGIYCILKYFYLIYSFVIARGFARSMTVCTNFYQYQKRGERSTGYGFAIDRTRNKSSASHMNW